VPRIVVIGGGFRPPDTQQQSRLGSASGELEYPTLPGRGRAGRFPVWGWIGDRATVRRLVGRSGDRDQAGDHHHHRRACLF